MVKLESYHNYILHSLFSSFWYLNKAAKEVVDGGTIEDDEVEQVEQEEKTQEVKKKPEIQPYISHTDTVQVKHNVIQ